MPSNIALRLCLLALLSLVSLTGYSQAGPATVRGTVTDPDSAVIPGATVTLTPKAGAATIVTSQPDGTYVLLNIAPGQYSLTITMSGFASYVQQALRVNAGQQLIISPKLAIQDQSQQVQVNAQSTQLSVDPDANASATVIKGADLDALSDDPDELSDELTALAGPAAGPSGGQLYIDGFTGGQLPPKSSIREIRVNQNPFSAQFDKMGFGRIEVFTKPGTDKFHGNYSIQGGDKPFNTSNPFLGSTNAQPGYYTLFMLGSVTGPINRFSSFSVGGSRRTIQDNNIVNPSLFYATSASSTDVCAPGSGGACSVQTGYPVSARAVFHPQTRSDFTPRLDLALGNKNTVTARYEYYDNSQKNAGVGNTNLPSVGYSSEATENTIQISDTQVLSARVINETRFEFERDTGSQTPNSTAPTLSVQGIFTAGGSSLGASNDTRNHIEIQNYTSIQLKKNFVRLGGRLRSDSETLTSNAGSNGTFSYASLADYSTGNLNLFRRTEINNATVQSRLTDVGLYLEDDWKPRSNLTINYGLRYEAQTVINSKHDLAPRLAVSYGIPRSKGEPITVLRAGFGMFYDRFALSDVLTTQQLNGSNQIQLVVQTPGSACTPSTITGCGTQSALLPTTYLLGSGVRSAYNEQGILGVDQQLGKIGSVSANFSTEKGIHQYLSRAFPLATAGALTGYSDQFQSAGYYRENQLLLNTSIHAKRLTLWGFYSLNFADSNTGGADTFATNPYNSHVDYGRASFSHRSFGVGGGSLQLPVHITLSPFLIAQSGTFYDVTSGLDTNQDGQINDRPFYAANSARSCTNATDYSSTDTGGLAPVPVNSCTGPANLSFNLRANKTFGIGPKVERAGSGGDSGPGGGPRGGPGGRGGGGRGGPGGGSFGSNTGHRYNLTLGAQAANLFNVVPYGTPVSVTSSTRFGRFTTLAGGPFSSSTAVRRVTLQASFSF